MVNGILKKEHHESEAAANKVFLSNAVMGFREQKLGPPLSTAGDVQGKISWLLTAVQYTKLPGFVVGSGSPGQVKSFLPFIQS